MTFKVATAASPGRLRFKRHYTTGEVARALQVAPRTVSKWVDGGLLDGFHLPRKGGRRIPRAGLVRFARESGIDLDITGMLPSLLLISASGTLAEGLSAGLPSDIGFLLASDWFIAGVHAGTLPGIVVVDMALTPRPISLAAVASVRRTCPKAVLAVVACEDEIALDEIRAAGADLVYQHPVCARQIVTDLVEED